MFALGFLCVFYCVLCLLCFLKFFCDGGPYERWIQGAGFHWLGRKKGLYLFCVCGLLFLLFVVAVF